MINKTELRIGNIFPSLTKDKYVAVQELGEHMANIGGSWIPYDSLFPIELSEEIILKLGFEREWDDNCAFPEYSNGILTIFGTSQPNIFECNQSNTPLRYLHRFQNLHFELTGFEITCE